MWTKRKEPEKNKWQYMSRYSIPLEAGRQWESRQECRILRCFSWLGRGQSGSWRIGFVLWNCGKEKVKYTRWDYEINLAKCVFPNLLSPYWWFCLRKLMKDCINVSYPDGGFVHFFFNIMLTGWLHIKPIFGIHLTCIENNLILAYFFCIFMAILSIFMSFQWVKPIMIMWLLFLFLVMLLGLKINFVRYWCCYTSVLLFFFPLSFPSFIEL